MSPAPLALALLGVAGWFLLLARGETPASRLRLLVEAVCAETVIATLIAVGLVTVGAFRPSATLALAAALAVLQMVERRFTRRGIVYPTDHDERLRRYYPYDLVFAGDESGKTAPPPMP